MFDSQRYMSVAEELNDYGDDRIWGELCRDAAGTIKTLVDKLQKVEAVYDFCLTHAKPEYASSMNEQSNFEFAADMLTKILK